VEAGRGGGAVAAVGADRARLAAARGGQRGAGRVRQLRADHRGPGHEVDGATLRVARHLPALRGVLAVAEHVRDVVLQRHAALERDAAFAQPAEDPVLGREGGGRGVDRGLLAGGSADEADAALPLQFQHAVVEQSHRAHRAPDRQQRRVRRQRRRPLPAQRAPVLLQRPDQRNAGLLERADHRTHM
jgi:hypothetical protein